MTITFSPCEIEVETARAPAHRPIATPAKSKAIIVMIILFFKTIIFTLYTIEYLLFLFRSIIIIL